MSDIYNITAEHPDDCDCAHCYDPVRRVADLQTQRDTLARALLESQAALAAANARAESLAIENHDRARQQAQSIEDWNGINADLALVTADLATARESVREMVAGLATAKDSMLDGAAAVQRLILLHGSSAKAETLAGRMRTKADEIDALLAKHAAPAAPAAVLGLVFGEPDEEKERSALASDGERYVITPSIYPDSGAWYWRSVRIGWAGGWTDTIEEAIAAANAHNAARLKGGE